MLVFAFIVMLSQLGPNWGTESPSTSASPNISCHLKCFSNGSCIVEANPCDGGQGCGPSADQQNCLHHAVFAHQLHITHPGEVTSANPVVALVNSTVPPMLMNLPFADKILNPCAWKSQPSFTTSEETRATFIREFYTVVSRYASLGTEDNLEMLTNHTIANCIRLQIDNLPYTPTLEDLEGLNVDEALNKIYLSLLVHSAYSFFIHHQYTSNDLKCSGNDEWGQSFANKSLLLARKQKTLACYVRVSMSALEYALDDVLPLLNDTISDSSLCSRRAIRDCQVMKSTHNFLGIVSLYTSRKIQEFTTTTAPQATTLNR